MLPTSTGFTTKFPSRCPCAGGAVAIAAQMLSTSKAAEGAWHSFVMLPDTDKYLISVLVVSALHFVSKLFPASDDLRLGLGRERYPGLLPRALSLPDPRSTEVRDWEGDLKGSFASLCDVLIEEVLDELASDYEAIPEQLQWMRAMLEYNVKGGKMNRGLGVIDVQKAFAKSSGRTLSHREHCRAAVLGWCIEWLQAFFLVADDVMDDSHTRRGQPCWFRVPHVKQIAINDAFILESLVFKVLNRHFSQESYYLQLMELFHDVTYRTEMGQLLDLTSQPLDKPPDFTRFTKTRYAMIVKYKTAFYTFYLPCAIGMIYAGVSDPSSFALARRICCTIGEYFQIQDDYLDCYGDPKFIGKVGTDIQDMKCSWLVVQALERCSAAQKDELIANYGKDDAEKIGKVKAIYNDLKLADVYHAYEEQSYKEIQGLIEEVKDVPKDVYHNFVKRIYKRDK
ncbi:farnesyl pyrophosphate synthase [Tribonema minus]|uniref:Farnesyl pyrophosphate synthase n=1 Tax=Tribonema minus TaxID=303371 RepID=A0A835YUF9_9STRA|nr:farnesyl pyrophosphate synthase [Tribonema minus]